jgi:hypothetical protein
MGVRAYRKVVERGELVGVAALFLIGIALIALAPAKQSASPADAQLPSSARRESAAHSN